jgi:hypothetical protein
MSAAVISNSTMADPRRPWLEVTCTACWPHTDGHQTFGPTWAPGLRPLAEAAAEQHNAARHPKEAAA